MAEYLPASIYTLAWRLFSSKIASRRRRLIPKDELMRWQLWALEEAIRAHGQQEEA